MTSQTTTSKPRVAVIGAGSWGTALAALIARHGHPTVLWGRDGDIAAAIDARHENPRYLPGIALPDALRATTDLTAALAGADLVLVVTPSHAFAETLRALAPHRPVHAGVAWATKGFEPGSGRFLHEVAEEVLGAGVPLAVVTGPSFAKEVAQGLPTALTVHSDDADFAQSVADALHGPAFRAYTGDDMLGAELGGAMKNVLAVATGVADGMQLGLNARAGLITRGLNEMLRLNQAIGGQPETLMGLAGLGDLVLTCTGDYSSAASDVYKRQLQRRARSAARPHHPVRRPAPAARARAEARVSERPVRLRRCGLGPRPRACRRASGLAQRRVFALAGRPQRPAR